MDNLPTQPQPQPNKTQTQNQAQNTTTKQSCTHKKPTTTTRKKKLNQFLQNRPAILYRKKLYTQLVNKLSLINAQLFEFNE
jgi:hypothetical protein